jgi:hypothetical protein
MARELLVNMASQFSNQANELINAGLVRSSMPSPSFGAISDNSFRSRSSLR